MCGICGFYTPDKYGIEALRKMNESMIHRGPDDHGEEIYTDSAGRTVGLGHRRLSIMDLTMAGHQPMVSSDGRYALVYNGEIYNFTEIRETLQKRGITFTTRCDTEVVLKSYIEYGVEAFSMYNGMFALAIYDRADDKLVLARDRIGVKPLYYYSDGRSFVWGSELKPIMLYPGFRKEIRADILSRFFCFDYINSPDTVFENTYKIEPGQYLIYQGGEIRKEAYWDLLEQYKLNSADPYQTYEDAKRATIELTEDAVCRRMVADVPVGTFLSGGIDSTLVTAIAQKYSHNPVKTYTIGFDTAEENEAVYAGEVARALGTDHTELYIGENELYELLKDMPVYYDEPFADPSQLPTMLVSKLAKRDVSVVLSGDGGDELYCGYPAYDWIYKAQKLDAFGAVAYYMGGRLLENRVPNIVYSFMENRNARYKSQFVEGAKTRAMEHMLTRPYVYPKYDYEEKTGNPNWQIRRMLVDMRTYLPENNLCKMDRASMKYSLEARNPLIDYRLVENSFRIPHEYKYHEGIKKYILKDITYDYVDRKLLDRPKQGFAVPMTKWLRLYLKDEIEQFLNKDILKRQGLFEYDYMRYLADTQRISDKTIYTDLMWDFYVFERWYREYVEDLWA